jgi:hypothetical protein
MRRMISFDLLVCAPEMGAYNGLDKRYDNHMRHALHKLSADGELRD